MAPPIHGLTWKQGSSLPRPLRPTEVVTVIRAHDKKKEKVVFKFWMEQQPIEAWKPKEAKCADGSEHAIVMVGDLQSDKLYSGADSTFKIEKGSPTPLSSAAPVQQELKFSFVLIATKTRKSLFKVPIEIPMPLTPNNKRTVMTVKVFVNDKEEKGLVQHFEVFTRIASWREKMEEFLAWQDRLVYGPPTGVKLSSKTLSYWADKRWGVQQGEDKDGNPVPPKIFHASASGETKSCYVCSPLVNAFMAYWCNLHDTNFKTINRAGSDARAIASAYADFFEGGKAPLDPPFREPEAATVAELNELEEDERDGVTYELSDAGDLENGSKALNVKAGQFVAWKGEKWVTIDAKKAKQKPAGWTWAALNEQLSNAAPGDLYVCATGTHVWFMAVMDGVTFTVKKKYIFGKDDGDCVKGIYRIHASPSVPLAFGYRKYLRESYIEAKIPPLEKELEAAKKKAEASEKAEQEAKAAELNKTNKRAYGELKEEADTDRAVVKGKEGELKLYNQAKVNKGAVRNLSGLRAALEAIKNKPEKATNETTVAYADIYKNLITHLDDVEKDASYDGIFAFGGTDLTDQNSQLLSGPKGKLYLDRGGGVPDAFRRGGASGSFRVWKVKRVIDDKTGWVLPKAREDNPKAKTLQAVALHDCRPIDSEK